MELEDGRRGRGEGGGGVPKWRRARSVGPRDKISPLCPCGGPGATDPLVSFSYFANLAIIFYSRGPFSPRPPFSYPFEGPFGLSLIFCSLTFRYPSFHLLPGPSSAAIVPFSSSIRFEARSQYALGPHFA